jgi:hypothetical protein
LKGLILPHCYACPKPECRFLPFYEFVISVFETLKCARYVVDIVVVDYIVNHYCTLYIQLSVMYIHISTLISKKDTNSNKPTTD